MKKIVSIFICIFSLYFLVFSDDGVLFRFNQKQGDSSSHICTIEEQAFLNDKFVASSEYITRMTSTVTSELENGDARIQGKYMTTRAVLSEDGKTFVPWSDNETTVNISRKSNGFLYDSDNATMPNVRGVPSFPSVKLHIGDCWKMRGEEIHDLREMFGMDTIIRIPFTATYTYTKDEEIDGKIFRVIDVSYELHQRNVGSNRLYKKGTFAGIQEYAQQRIYWDSEKNLLDHYTEDYSIQMVDIYSNIYLYTSSAEGKVTAYKSVNNDEQVQKIQETVDNYKLDDISVSKGEKGITISIENIQFQPDSDILLESEKEKLIKLGELLKSFPNDLLVTGHCAKRGTEKEQQELSETRAERVASFLVDNNVRDEMHIFTQGKGAKEPIATNDTEEGRSKNRRVEITIMD